MLPLLLAPALAAPLCGTPDALAVLAGVAPAHDPRVLAPPPGLRMGIAPDAPAPPDTKPTYGTPYEDHETSENFLVTWTDSSVDPAVATQTLADLEDAWAALVEDQAWPVPVSGDTYKLWVVLDPTLSGTGLTTEYTTDDYPEGYPVIFLNPTWASDTRFWRSLAAHEFSHALQYRLRDYAGETWEPWYWEASAQWQSELADPDNDGHLYTAAWYADRPGDAYDSMVDSHQYGMFVFNAWLEEHQTGPDGLRQVWLLADDRQGDSWDQVLAESTGEDPATLWAGFTGVYGNGGLAQSADYAAAAQQGTLGEGVGGNLAYLGTDYWSVAEDGEVRLLVDAGDEAVLGGVSGTGQTLAVGAGEVLAVTGIVADGFAAYTLTLEAGGGDGGGSGGSDGSGGEDGGGSSGSSGLPSDDDDKATSCASATAPWALGLLVLPFSLARRRYRDW
jgi:hypothetical protein